MLLWQEPFYYRLGNVFIHALAATAWFCLVREITGQTIVAAAAGPLFLVYPTQTQAVTYITQRFESQAVMFMLCSAAAYARFRRTKRNGWIAAVVGFAIAAAFTKETAVILPVWLLLIELVFFERGWIRNRAFAYMVPLGLASVGDPSNEDLYQYWISDLGLDSLGQIPADPRTGSDDVFPIGHVAAVAVPLLRFSTGKRSNLGL